MTGPGIRDTDLVPYVRAVIGEFADDFDVAAIARECFEWEPVRGVFQPSTTGDEFWSAVERLAL